MKNIIFFICVTIITFQFVYPNNKSIDQSPIDIKTRQVILQPVNWAEMNIDSLKQGFLIAIDYSGQNLDLSNRSFNKFKRSLKEYFIVHKYKERINIYYKKNDGVATERISIPDLQFDRIDSDEGVITINWSWMKGAILMNPFRRLFSRDIIDHSVKNNTIESRIISIAKIKHEISIPHATFLATKQGFFDLPKPKFRIGKAEYTGKDDYVIKLELDSRKNVQWESYTPSRDEQYELDGKNILIITIPSKSLASKLSISLGELRIRAANYWEGPLPLHATISRNNWYKTIDLSNTVEIGKLDVALRRPAFLHPQSSGQPNYSNLNIKVGSQVLVEKDDEFILTLPRSSAASFKKDYIKNPSQGEYIFEVINTKTCKIILSKTPERNSTIQVMELPFELSNKREKKGEIKVKYPGQLGSKTIKQIFIVPKVTVLNYHLSPQVSLPKLSFKGIGKGRITSAFIIPQGNKAKNLIKEFSQEKIPWFPEIDVSLKNRKRDFYVDYILKQGSQFYAWRRIVHTGAIEVKDLSSSSLPWRVLDFPDKPQLLPEIQVIDKGNILQEGDSLIFRIPNDIGIIFDPDRLQAGAVGENGKNYFLHYSLDYLNKLILPPIIIKKHLPVEFKIIVEIRTKNWKSIMPVKGSIMVGSPNILLGPTRSFVLFKKSNKLPSIQISDDNKFLRKGDILLFDFYFEDGTPVAFNTMNPKLSDSGDGYKIQRHRNKPNQYFLSIPKIKQRPIKLNINGLNTGVITGSKHTFVTMTVSIQGFKDMFQNFEHVLRATNPLLKFQKPGGFWVAEDVVEDVVQIEYSRNKEIKSFDDVFYVSISIPTSAGAQWDTSYANHRIPYGISPQFSTNTMNITLGPESVSNSSTLLGEYALIPSKTVGSAFQFEYNFQSVSHTFTSDSMFAMYKPEITISKEDAPSQRKDIYIHQGDSIKINIPLITFMEKSAPLLNKEDYITFKWSNPSWVWKKLGNYNTEKLTRLRTQNNTNELQFQLTESINRGEMLQFHDIDLLYNGRRSIGTDSLIVIISKADYDYSVSAPNKIISSYHEVKLEEDQLVWSRDKIRTPSFSIRGSFRSVLSPEREIVIRLRGSHTNPVWKKDFRWDDIMFSGKVSSKNQSLLYLKPKRILDPGNEIIIPSIPLENVNRNTGEIIAEISFDGGENFPISKPIIHVIQPALISSDSPWRLMVSSKPQPLNKIRIVDNEQHNCFIEGNLLSIILPQTKSVQFVKEMLETLTFSGSAKAKIGTPLISDDNLMIRIPIIESFNPGDDLEINGLLVKTGRRLTSKQFSLNYAINSNAEEPPSNQIFLDQHEITISQINVQVTPAELIYSLLDSEFIVPDIHIKDDPAFPFFSKGDRLLFRFNKSPGYRLVFRQSEFRDNSTHQIQIMGTTIEVLIKNSLGTDPINLSGLYLEKPSGPMGLHTLRCEVIKEGISEDMKHFFIDIPFKIAFSTDIPSFKLVSDKEFLVNDRSRMLPNLILKEDSLLQTINRGSEVIVKLPSGFAGEWTTSSLQKIRLSGSAVNKITDIQFKDSRSLAIQIKDGFQTGDSLILSGIEIGKINTITENWQGLVLSLNNNEDITKTFNVAPGSGKIKSGEVKIIWSREQIIVPEGNYDSKPLDPLRIIRNSQNPLNSLGISQMYFSLEPLDKIRDAAVWDKKILNSSPGKFHHDVFTLKQIDRRLLEFQLNHSELSNSMLTFDELSIPGLSLSGFKKDRNSEYKLVMRIESGGPIIAECTQKIIIDWNGQQPMPFANPFNKGKTIRLYGISESKFVDYKNTQIMVNKVAVSNSAKILRTNEINFELNHLVEKGTRVTIENITISLLSTNESSMTILPKIGLDTGFGFIPFTARQKLIVNTVTNKVSIQGGNSKSNDYIDDIFIDYESGNYEGGKLTFDLEFEVKSDRNREMVNIENRRDEIYSKLFPKGVPGEIPDVTATNNVMSNADNMILINSLSNAGIGQNRWQYHYLLALIYHFADNAQATNSYNKAIEFGYNAEHYADWPQNPFRESDKKVVLNRVKHIINYTKSIPDNFFSPQRTRLSPLVNEKIEIADDLLLKIQEYPGWEKYIKDYSATKYPELNIDFYISQIDVALGLGDIAAAENLTTRLTRDRKLRQVSKKIKKDNNYKKIYDQRKQKIDWENKNQKSFPKEDRNTRVFLTEDEKDNAYDIVLNDETNQEIRFRISSRNDKDYNNKKLRSNKSNAKLYGGGIYTIDPEIENDKKKINRLNIIFSIVSFALLVLI